MKSNTLKIWEEELAIQEQEKEKKRAIEEKKEKFEQILAERGQLPDKSQETYYRILNKMRQEKKMSSEMLAKILQVDDILPNIVAICNVNHAEDQDFLPFTIYCSYSIGAHYCYNRIHKCMCYCL